MSCVYFMKKAFSLIEILIVVAVMGIMTGTGITYYNSFTQSKQLELESKKMADVLDLAKKKASAGDMFTACASGTALMSYQVVITGTTYDLQQCCGANNSCTTPTTVNSYTIQSSAITIVSTAGNVAFKTLSQGAIIGAGNPIKFKSSSGSCIDVTISNLGLVDVGSSYTTGC